MTLPYRRVMVLVRKRYWCRSSLRSVRPIRNSFPILVPGMDIPLCERTALRKPTLVSVGMWIG
jgi:hypothetical protein